MLALDDARWAEKIVVEVRKSDIARRLTHVKPVDRFIPARTAETKGVSISTKLRDRTRKSHSLSTASKA